MTVRTPAGSKTLMKPMNVVAPLRNSTKARIETARSTGSEARTIEIDTTMAALAANGIAILQSWSMTRICKRLDRPALSGPVAMLV